MRTINRILTTLLVAGLAATLGLVAAQPAVAAPASTAGQAISIMRMSYVDFLAYKKRRPAPFDWNDDGCSGPKRVKPVYAKLFNGPCQQHDFGYDNFGRGYLHLGLNEDTRAWIDGRFLQEMRRVCDRNFRSWWEGPKKTACLAEASAVWGAVRHGGRPAYYDE